MPSLCLVPFLLLSEYHRAPAEDAFHLLHKERHPKWFGEAKSLALCIPHSNETKPLTLGLQLHLFLPSPGVMVIFCQLFCH